MTDWKARCAELTEALCGYTLSQDDCLLVDRTRAELAQPEPTGLPPGYIDPEHTGADRHLLQVFYRACQSEGGTADEINLRGIRAVLADTTLAQPAPEGPTDGEIEEAAKLIYASMRFAVPDYYITCDWVERGNSLVQDEARRTARAILARFGRPSLNPQ
jgi:hypothetical protein